MRDIPTPLIELVERMPAFPNSVQRILTLTSDINCAPRDLVSVIEHDPVLTLKILKLVNSAYFGLSRKVTSIPHSVVYLGINTVKNLALSVATIGVLPKSNKAGLDIHLLLVHSLLTGNIARSMAKLLSIPERDWTDFFVAGLLHDVGQIIFALHLPAEYRQIRERARQTPPLVQAEIDTLGASHADLGALLVEKWRFPETITVGIRHHHDTGPERPLSALSDCLYLANLASPRDPAASHAPPPHLLERFGGDWESLLTSLGNLQEERMRAEEIARL